MAIDLASADAAYSDADLRGVALVRAEYHRIVELLGRVPNHVELGIFGAMWSEHCGYKNSRPLLKRFQRVGCACCWGRARRTPVPSTRAQTWRSSSRARVIIIPARSSRFRTRRPAWARRMPRHAGGRATIHRGGA